MGTVVNWDGVELRALPKGRYVLVSVDEATELTPEQEAGLDAALASIRVGHRVTRDEARKRVDAVLGR